MYMMENYILGPVIIPNKKILRAPNSKVDDYHYVLFSSKTIKNIREKFHNDKMDNKLNINHKGELLKDVFLTKSFILDKVNIKTIHDEFKVLPLGTWMIEYRVDNQEVWQMIKDKKINGLSIEGIFDYEEI